MMQKRFRWYAVALALLWGAGLGARAEKSFQLFDPGMESIVHYEKYGQFSGVGTSTFRYYISNREGLGHEIG